jgi:sporulation protein YlmC with PRC-barrel domain
VKATDLVGHPVMDLATATSIGRIDDAVVDPATRRVAGFVLKKTPAKADWLPWEQVNAVGADAVTVANAEAIVDRGALSGHPLRADKVVGGRVLTNQGWEQSSLADVDFDPATGQVTGLVLADGTTLAPGDLIGIGRYATVVQHPA